MSIKLPDYQKHIHERINRSDAIQLEELAMPVLAHDSCWIFRSTDIKKILIPGRNIPVPAAPAHILGIVPLNGVIYTVVDFNVLLGRAHVPATAKSRLVCFEHNGDYFALYVERALDMISITSLGEAQKSNQRFCDATFEKSGKTYQLGSIQAISHAAMAN